MKLSTYQRLELFFNIFFFRFLNLNGPLQLGGVSTRNLLYPKLTVTSYKGCIRNVISQGKYYDLKTPSYRNGTKKGCPMMDQHCRRHQCDSRSKCVPSWTGYSCSCPFGFSGPTCSRSKFKLFLRCCCGVACLLGITALGDSKRNCYPLGQSDAKSKPLIDWLTRHF